MREEERATLEADLPPGWKLRTRITRATSGSAVVPGLEVVTFEAESETHNVVIEGSWNWLKKRVISYALSAKA